MHFIKGRNRPLPPQWRASPILTGMAYDQQRFRCMLLGMEELPLGERLDRVSGAASREAARFVPQEDRGEAIYRACLGACQILDTRPDGDRLRLQQEPPAPDYPDIWARLNRRWRESNGP